MHFKFKLRNHFFRKFLWTCMWHR